MARQDKTQQEETNQNNPNTEARQDKTTTKQHYTTKRTSENKTKRDNAIASNDTTR